jgi:hypothetical protein
MRSCTSTSTALRQRPIRPTGKAVFKLWQCQFEHASHPGCWPDPPRADSDASSAKSVITSSAGLPHHLHLTHSENENADLWPFIWSMLVADLLSGEAAGGDEALGRPAAVRAVDEIAVVAFSGLAVHHAPIARAPGGGAALTVATIVQEVRADNAEGAAAQARVCVGDADQGSSWDVLLVHLARCTPPPRRTLQFMRARPDA